METKETGKKLFVAGVSWNTTDDGFLNFFARFGDIQEALVMRERGGRSRGFGFVTYKDSSIAEKVKAAAQSQQLTLDGHKLDITEAIPRQEMLSSSQANNKKLYVAGVSWNTTDEALADFFSRFGTVVSSQIQRDRATGRSRGFGFVTFEDASSCEKVLAETNLAIEGRRLEIKQAVPRGMVGAFGDDSGPTRFTSAAPFSGGPVSAKPKKIFVAGITHDVQEEDLKEHFSTYGKILECYIQKDRATGESRGFGFVSFDSSDAVEKVLLKPSQKIGDKCVVDIKIARPKGEIASEQSFPGMMGGGRDPPPRGASVYGYGLGGLGGSSGLSEWSGPGPYGGSGWGGGLSSGVGGYGGGLGGGLGAGTGLGSSLSLPGRTSAYGVGGGVTGRTEYAPYPSQGYEQSYGGGGGGYGVGGQSSVGGSGGYGGSSGYGESGGGGLGLGSTYSQWGGPSSQLDDTKRGGYETPYGGGGGYSQAPSGGYDSGTGQYSYGALRRTTAPPTARRGYHPYGR